MARQKSVKEILRESMPAVEIVEAPPGQSDATPTDPPATPGPSAAELRRKYLTPAAGGAGDPADSGRVARLRDKYLAAADSGGAADEEAAEHGDAAAGDPQHQGGDDVEVVRVRSKARSDDPTGLPGARTVIVSKSKGKIIGQQG